MTYESKRESSYSQFILGCFCAVLSAIASQNAQAQADVDKEITPESMGFTSQTLEKNGETIRYYVSTEGNAFDKGRKLPLVVYLDGSGPSPLVWRDEKGRVGNSMMFDAQDFNGYHFAVISKPGIQFFENTMRIRSEEYDKKMCLRWRIDAASSVVNDLVKNGSIETETVLILGHSEGSDVAPWVALENQNVTHVAALAPGGLSLMFDFIALTRKQMTTGELDREEGEQLIRDIKSGFRKVFSDPDSTTEKWSGEAHLRWSTFFRPSLDAWKDVRKPAYIGVCLNDNNTAVDSGELIELEFIRLQKSNLKATYWHCDHYFIDGNSDKDKPVDRRLEVLKDLLLWAENQQALAPEGESKSAQADSEAKDAFDQLKQLVGTWVEETASDKKIKVSYSLMARGSVLQENWQMPSGSDAMTLYHMDGSQLIATHYCPKGNQPTLELRSSDPNGNYDFRFRNGTNLDSNMPFQYRFRIRISEAGKLWRSETYSANGIPTESQSTFIRTKEPKR